MDELSSEELAGRFGVTANQLWRLVELGVITPTPQGRFGRSDIQRIRVADALAAAGFAPSSSASCSPPAPTTWSGPAWCSPSRPPPWSRRRPPPGGPRT